MSLQYMDNLNDDEFIVYFADRLRKDIDIINAAIYDDPFAAAYALK